jgi:hypothetical protein
LLIATLASPAFARPDPTPPDEVLSKGIVHRVSNNPPTWQRQWGTMDSSTACSLHSNKFFTVPGMSFLSFSHLYSEKGWPIYMPRGSSISNLEDWARHVNYKHYNGPGSGSTIRNYYKPYTNDIIAISVAAGCILTLWTNANSGGSSRAWHGGLSGYTETLGDRSAGSASCSCGVIIDPIPLIQPVL